MPTALVTGPKLQADEIADALRSAGYDTVCEDGSRPWNEFASMLPQQSLDCWIQLPPADPETPAETLDAARNLVTDAVVARFAAAASLAPLLAPQATVVIVEGRGAAAGPVGRLVRTLAEAIARDHAPTQIRARVVEATRPAEEIAAVALGRPPAAVRSWADIEPDAPFDDWRRAVFAATTP
jgi:hypothetical protein